MNELEDVLFDAFPETQEPTDYQRDLPDHCTEEDDSFYEDMEEN
jgi:hypothetical protein